MRLTDRAVRKTSSRHPGSTASLKGTNGSGSPGINLFRAALNYIKFDAALGTALFAMIAAGGLAHIDYSENAEKHLETLSAFGRKSDLSKIDFLLELLAASG